MDQSWRIAGQPLSKSRPALRCRPFDKTGKNQDFQIDLRCLSDIDDALIARWGNLADRASEPNVFNEADFLSIAMEQCDVQSCALLACMWSGKPGTSPLVGLMPLVQQKGYGRWPVRYTQNWLHNNSFLGTPLVRVGFERAFWTRLLGFLDEQPDAGLFLHLEKMALDGPLFAALSEFAKDTNRRCDIVQSGQRAVLASTTDGSIYYAETVRKKKRKELNRLRNRLSELGSLETVEGLGAQSLGEWTEEFLALERQGWKGQNHSALADQTDTRSLFIKTLEHAQKRDRLHCIAMRLDGRAIAMLVNFLSPPGGFSFKTAFDENYAHFSPGVLLQIDNLDVLAKNNLKWMDSCAVEGHPMINSLWAERREIGRVSVALKGNFRPHIFNMLRIGEDFMSRRRMAALIAEKAGT
jgi:hypothetical protein